MTNLSFRLFSVLLIYTASLFAAPVIADSIEEIIVKANYRETLLEENDGSLLLLEEKQLQDQPMKHFEERFRIYSHEMKDVHSQDYKDYCYWEYTEENKQFYY